MGGLLGVLDTRAFASVWYWLLLAGSWAWLGRGALGIPTDLVRGVRRGAEGADLLLLDWLSLVTPRWRVEPRDGAILTGLATFVLSSLIVLGFAYRLQLAQALALLLGPMLLLAWLRVRLATRLRATLGAAETGELPPDAAAAEAAGAIARHLRATAALSMMAVAVAAIWGTRWLALHPNGL